MYKVEFGKTRTIYGNTLADMTVWRSNGQPLYRSAAPSHRANASILRGLLLDDKDESFFDVIHNKFEHDSHPKDVYGEQTRLVTACYEHTLDELSQSVLIYVYGDNYEATRRELEELNYSTLDGSLDPEAFQTAMPIIPDAKTLDIAYEVGSPATTCKKAVSLPEVSRKQAKFLGREIGEGRVEPHSDILDLGFFVYRPFQECGSTSTIRISPMDGREAFTSSLEAEAAVEALTRQSALHDGWLYISNWLAFEIDVIA